MATTPSRPRRSSRLRSTTPSQPENAHAPKRVKQTEVAAAFNPGTIINSIARGNHNSIAKLTKAQLEAVIFAYADRDAESQKQITTLTYEKQQADHERKTTSMNRRKAAEMVRMHQEKKAAQAKVEAARQTAEFPASTSSPQQAAQQATSPRPVTPPDAIIPSPAAPASSWLWGSISRILPFSSSFSSSKKRRAEDEPTTDEPAQKRQKPAQQQEQAPQERMQATEPAQTASDQRSIFRSSTTSPEQLKEQPNTTYTSKSTQQTPRRPATAANNEPPATAPPRSVTFVQSTKIPAKTPKRKRTTQTAAVATPLPAITEASPLEMHTITPRPRRTLENARAAQSERKAKQTAQPVKPYAWEQKPAPAREPNADARIARIRHAEHLRRELKRMEAEDPYIRPTKRVKIDKLARIPHNRPGDSSSTFRVPDCDSDEEMEVYSNTEELPNVFTESIGYPETPMPTAQQQQQPAFTPSTQPPTTSTPANIFQAANTPLPPPPQLPAHSSVTTSLPPASAPATNTTTTAAIEQQTPTPLFDFPLVKPKPADYFVTDGYKNHAGELFAEGFAQFIAERA